MSDSPHWRSNDFLRRARLTLGLCGVLGLVFLMDCWSEGAAGRLLILRPERIFAPRSVLEAAQGLLTLPGYALIHLDARHLALNLMMILPFGIALERRRRTTPGVFFAGALMGAAAQILGDGRPALAGSSAGAAALAAAWARGRDEGWRFFLFAALWMAANHPALGGGAGGVSWRAHLGGFLAGMLFAPRIAANRSSESPDQSP